MTNRRTRGSGKSRQVDWTGINQDVVVFGAGATASTNLWTPVTEARKATVTRIRGNINPTMSGSIMDADQGPHQMEIFCGIQVVNRAQGVTGTERSPAFEDDLEGSEWLYLQSWLYSWEVLEEHSPPTAIGSMVVTGGDALTGAYNTQVDVKSQRIIDLSQDELLVTFAAAGSTSTFFANMHVYLRLLLKY